MIAVFFAHLAAMYVPFLQRVFQTVPLTGAEWLRVIPAPASALIAVELHKWVYRKRGTARAQAPAVQG